MYHVYYLVYRPFAATVCTRRAPKNAREKLRKRGSSGDTVGFAHVTKLSSYRPFSLG